MSVTIIAPEIQAATADAYNPNNTSGTATTNTINGSNSWIYRAYKQFDLSAIPTGAVVTSAKMYMFAHYWNDNGGSDLWNIGRCTVAWDELTLTWNNKPATAGQYLATWQSPIPVNTWGYCDIASLVQEWIDGASPNFGFQVLNYTEGNYRRNWSVRNRRYGDGTYASYIEVTFEADAHVPSGEYLCPSISINGREITGQINGVISKPTGTDVKFYTTVTITDTLAGTEVWVEQAQQVPITNWPEDPTNKYLWIKIALSTTDIYYTPKISALWLEESESNAKFVRIVLPDAGRLKYPQGVVTVAYDRLTGGMEGQWNVAVEDWEDTFTPTQITEPVFNPNAQEYLAVQLNTVSSRMHVDYVDTKLDEYLAVALTTVAQRINIDDLET